MKKLNKKKLLEALKKDLQESEVFRDAEDKKIQIRRNEYDGKPYGNEQKGKSAIVSRDIKKQGEWQHASIVDPFVATPDVIKCNPVTWEDKAASEQNEILLNSQFCRQFDRYNFMTKAVKILDREGTCVVQTGWEYEDKVVETEATVVAFDEETGEEYLTQEVIEETVVVTNKPTAKVCRNEDIYIDPTCMGDMDNCQFVIYRYETDLSTLKQDGRYKNLDKVKPDAEDAESHDDYDPKRTEVSTFKFNDDARKKIVVYEYWGNYDINNDGVAEPIVCAWVGDTVIRLSENPYPDKKPPFIVVPFNSVPFEIYGEANADLISDNQKVKTAIIRGLLDNMANSNNAQVGVPKGMLDPVNKKKFVDGKNFEYQGSVNGIWQGGYNSLPGSAFDMLAMMNNDIESITGVKSFSGGISGNSLGATATGVRGTLDATSTRRLNIVRNIAENLVKPLMRKWMAYNSEFLDDSEVVRITNDKFVEIRRDDLDGKIDIDITISTQEDNAAKVQELSFLLQTNAASMDPDLVKMIQAEIARLYRMPDLAKKIEEFQPQANPMQEQMQKLELLEKQKKIEKIDADIAAIYAGASEDDADRFEKIAQAQYKLAQTRKLNSEADITDLEFIRKDNKEDHLEKLELEDFKRLANLDVMALQRQAGDKELGVIR